MGWGFPGESTRLCVVWNFPPVSSRGVFDPSSVLFGCGAEENKEEWGLKLSALNIKISKYSWTFITDSPQNGFAQNLFI